MDGDSIRRWIPGLLKRQAAAIEAVVRHLRPSMLLLARALLRNSSSAEGDEEDVVNAALHSFLRRAADDQFPQLRDEDDLWRVVQTIVTRKALNQRRRDRRRRDQGVAEPHEAAAAADSDPAMIAMHNDLCLWLVEQLRDPELQRIAQLKLEGRTNLEIAVELSRSLATIERRLRLIRSRWYALQLPGDSGDERA